MILTLNVLLLDCRLESALIRKKPHLNEPHRFVNTVIDLGVIHPLANSRVLYPALLQNTTNPVFVRVLKFPCSAISHNLDLMMRMERPSRTGGKCVIVKNA